MWAAHSGHRPLPATQTTLPALLRGLFKEELECGQGSERQRPPDKTKLPRACQCRRRQSRGFNPWVGKILGMVYPDRSESLYWPFLIPCRSPQKTCDSPTVPWSSLWPGSLLPPLHCRPGSRGWKVKVLVAQSCLTLCDPMDCSSPCSIVHGIL